MTNPSAQTMLAHKYEAGLRKMEAAGYEEFGEAIEDHKIVIATLRAASSPAAVREAQLRDCLQSIADASDKEPRQPDDADWRYRFLEAQRAARTTLAATPEEAFTAAGGAVRDQWFTDSRLPIMAMSGDHESDRTLKLHFRRKVTDKDRADLVEILSLSAAPPAAQTDVVREALEPFIKPMSRMAAAKMIDPTLGPMTPIDVVVTKHQFASAQIALSVTRPGSGDVA